MKRHAFLCHGPWAAFGGRRCIKWRHWRWGWKCRSKFATLRVAWVKWDNAITQKLFAWVVSWLTMTDRLPFRNRWSVIAGKWWCAFMRLAAHCFHSGSRYFPEIFHHRWGTIAGPTAEKPNKQAQGEDRWTWNVCSSVPLSSCLILIHVFHNLLLLFVSHSPFHSVY